MKSARTTSGRDCSLWPTPMASNNCNQVEIRLRDDRLQFVVATGYKGHSVSQKYAAITWTLYRRLLEFSGWEPAGTTRRPDRFSRPLHLTLRLGSESLSDGLTLNPRFVEWQMGWPKDWTRCAVPVTGFAHWLRRSRTALFEALSNADGEAIDLPSN